MPLNLKPRRPNPPDDRPSSASADIVVGLINNMPDSALESTETQFTGLLREAAGPKSVHLCFASLSEVIRGPAAREHMRQREYWTLEELQDRRPDALIVTGMEPGAGALQQEPYWQRFVQVLQWADSHTLSSVWSCLAAHAAALHLDGIARERRAQKLCGVFAHQIDASHALMQGIAEPLRLPHSRWNDLPIRRLRDAGYGVLSYSAETGADIFVRERHSLFVCFQGHPEYEAPTLLKEYRRDVGRFLRAEQAHYPTLPAGYLSSTGSAELEAFRERALRAPSPALFEEFPMRSVSAGLSDSWHTQAVRLYANWLDLVTRRKSAAMRTHGVLHAPLAVPG
jgi:homoserine O-succinyltransferase/O-acetyltransferase